MTWLYTLLQPQPKVPSHAIHADGLSDAFSEGAQAVAFLPAHLLQHLEAHVLVCQFLLRKLQVFGFLKRERWVGSSLIQCTLDLQWCCNPRCLEG